MTLPFVPNDGSGSPNAAFAMIANAEIDATIIKTRTQVTQKKLMFLIMMFLPERSKFRNRCSFSKIHLPELIRSRSSHRDRPRFSPLSIRRPLLGERSLPALAAHVLSRSRREFAL